MLASHSFSPCLAKGMVSACKTIPFAHQNVTFRNAPHNTLYNNHFYIPSQPHGTRSAPSALIQQRGVPLFMEARPFRGSYSPFFIAYTFRFNPHGDYNRPHAASRSGHITPVSLYFAFEEAGILIKSSCAFFTLATSQSKSNTVPFTGMVILMAFPRFPLMFI